VKLHQPYRIIQEGIFQIWRCAKLTALPPHLAHSEHNKQREGQ